MMRLIQFVLLGVGKSCKRALTPLAFANKKLGQVSPLENILVLVVIISNTAICENLYAGVEECVENGGDKICTTFKSDKYFEYEGYWTAPLGPAYGGWTTDYNAIEEHLKSTASSYTCYDKQDDNINIGPFIQSEQFTERSDAVVTKVYARNDVDWCLNYPEQFTLTGWMGRNEKISEYCPDGYRPSDDGTICVKDIKGDSCDLIKNPISITNGTKVHSETDINLINQGGVSFSRFYDSAGYYQGNKGTEDYTGKFGDYWFHNYDKTIYFPTDQSIVSAIVHRENGKIKYFGGDGKELFKMQNKSARLNKLTDTNGVVTWSYADSNGSTEIYDSTGRLRSITSLSGVMQILSYSDISTPAAIASEPGLLIKVTDDYGQHINISYDQQSHINTLTDTSGRVWSYSYDENGNLSQVKYPDNTPQDDNDNLTKIYHYENLKFKHALTGITDENGVRYSTYEYDVSGRAIATYHIGNAGRADITYDAIPNERVVTNGRGISSTYTIQKSLGSKFIKAVSGPGCQSCVNGDTAYEYDPNNNNLLAKVIQGVRTEYGGHDEYGNYGYKIEAASTPEQRRIEYTYDPSYFNKVATKTETSVLTGNSKITTYTYDDFGNRTAVTVDGFTPDGTAVSRTTTYQYNGPLHQLSQIDGPRTDVSDVTTLDYYANDVTQGFNRGRLQRITGPVGIVLRDNIQYTATGKVLSEDRPNGISLTYTYYAGNDRLETLTETSGTSSHTTRWTYLATGEVETITQADGTALATTTRLVYDDARRLIGMVDQLGNHIDYVLDTEGNRTDEKVFDNAGVLYKSVQQTFDLYNRLDTRTLVDEIIDYNFQADGSLDNSVNAKNVTTDFQYDALKRLTSTTGDLGGVYADTQDTLTQYVYDAGDRLTSVTSPNNSNTTYSYDDLGNLLSETSPDRGLRSYTYDEAGNVSSITDARGITVNYVYDALNRVTTIDYPGTSEDVTLAYDNAVGCYNGIGKLCAVTDASGSTVYRYDGFGNMVQQDKTELGINYVTAYSYDALNHVASLTLPNGRNVDYGYDALGRTASIDATVNGLQQTILHNTQYRPDGLLTDMEFGNGFVETRLYNLKARLTSQTMPTGAVNTAPTVALTIPNQLSDEALLFNFAVPAGTFVDADAGDVLTYAASLTGGSPLPAWLSFSPTTSTFSGTPLAGDVGVLNISVTATDTAGLSVATTFSLTINAAPGTVISGTSSNEYLTGSADADTIYGLGGNDNLSGGNGDDSLFGGDGDDYLNGGNDNDTLVGGAGNDTLIGGRGADTYRFSQGFGQDTLTDYDYTAGVVDRIVFDASITAADISFTRVASKLIITVGTSGDTITSNYWFNNAYYKIEEIVFEDGSPMITADDVYRATLTFNGTTASETIYGDYLADVISALGGNDSLYGYNGDDILDGGAGNDYLYGHNGDDTLVGGTGNDALYGDSGNDTYRFSIGDGQDVISEYDTSGGIDKVSFGPGITPAGMSYSQSGNDLIMLYAAGDQVTVRSWFVSDYYKMEQVVFDDGTVLTPADIAPLVAMVSEPVLTERYLVQHTDTGGRFLKVSGADSVPINAAPSSDIIKQLGALNAEPRLMVVLPETATTNGRYTVWQKGPETSNTWMRTATDPNAYDRPDTMAFLSDNRLTVWRKPAAAMQYLATTLSMDGYSRQSHYPAGEANQGRFLKVNHGGSLPTAGAIDSETWIYTYDANGNVDTIDSSTGSTIYGYDALDRLTSDDLPTQAADTLGYDRNGNRTTITDGVSSTNSIYLPNTNQLDTLGAGTIGHDLAGNRTSDRNGTRTFEYNNAGRLFKVYEGGALIATYTYNYQGQRTRKVTASGTTVYHYDLNGSLISETDELGAPIRDIVYRDTVPVAQIDVGLTSESIVYLHSDHLGTPRRGTNENGVVVWSWDSDAFGAAAANDDPDGDGVATVVNLRFPGQYYDGETGLHYNYFRYYDPSTGRYITSDPIGLRGGLNTYGYVNANPNGFIDPTGLVGWEGSITQVTMAFVVGGSFGEFEFTSDCVNGRRAKVSGLIAGFTHGIGASVMPGSLSQSHLQMQDFRESLNPRIFDGFYISYYAGASYTGGGIGISYLNLGDVRSPTPVDPNPLSYSIESNIGLGATITVGSSTVRSIEYEDCGCS